MAKNLTPELGVGDRIRFYRERRGLTQVALGGLIGRSEDWVSKVERGALPVERVPMLMELARVLRVRDLSALTGRAAITLTADGSPEHESTPEIRRVLTAQPSALGRDLPGEPLTADELAEQVAEAWRIYERETVRYSVVGSLLPKLLTEAYHAADAASGSSLAAIIGQQVRIYHLLQVFLRRIGESGLSHLAADRALVLSDQIPDAALISASAWNLCSTLTNAGHVEESADLALSTIDRYPLTADSSPEHVSAHGALHLAATIASVRAGLAPTAWDLLSQAKNLAERLGQDRNDFRTSFGPTNVAMHGVHLAAEEGDASEALRLADHVEDNPELPLERRTRYFIEVMHAHRLKRDDMGALWMVQKIRNVSPEEMVWHPLVRATVGDLWKRARPSYRNEVQELAEHMGLLA
jgi:transcriptional regulator with XRE-family HTH domain